MFLRALPGPWITWDTGTNKGPQLEARGLLADANWHSRWDGYPLPILNTLVPHLGQVPLVAGRLFFKVTCLGFLISTFFLHFMQYPCAIGILLFLILALWL